MRRVSAFAWIFPVITAGCLRGTLPPRQFYRLTVPDSVAGARASAAPALSAPIAVARYETPGIYASGALVYRVGTSTYGEYPAREWAIPLGEMLASMTEGIARQRALTSGRVAFDPGTRREGYEWRGIVREFDEVDAPTAVSASVSLSAHLVRVADDSIVWSGSARETEAIAQSRNIDAVVMGLSRAAARAIARLADDAAQAMRRLAAAGAQDR